MCINLVCFYFSITHVYCFSIINRNVSEKLYRGRRTQEAARFAAVIEAIRVAGSYGIYLLIADLKKSLQI